MKVLHTIADFRAWRRTAGTRVPFVPTMGALHDGHASLVRLARDTAGPAGHVAASIFVNPTQFGPAEDFAKYPRTLDADCQLLQAAGCDALFVPSALEMYPQRPGTTHPRPDVDIAVDPGPMASILEGAIRPGHFRGVCTVVLKLLNIVQPSHLHLGQKDFQQQAILRQMTLDLNLPVEVVTCPTIREPDGLAMSSRNRYLNPDQRARAVALHEALTWAKSAHDAGQRQASLLDAGMEQRLLASGLVPQYALVADAATLTPQCQRPDGLVANPAVLLIAAKLGVTRLIDNMPL